MCGLDLNEADELWETRQAWDQEIAGFGPDEFFKMKTGMERNFRDFRGEELLAYVRMTALDPKALRKVLPFLRSAAETGADHWTADFIRLQAAVLVNHFPIGDDDEFATEVADLVRYLTE